MDENWGYFYEPSKSNTEFPYLHSSPLSFTPGLAAGHRAAQQAIKLQEAILDVIRLGFLASVLDYDDPQHIKGSIPSGYLLHNYGKIPHC